jgi:hypothetical protein
MQAFELVEDKSTAADTAIVAINAHSNKKIQIEQ